MGQGEREPLAPSIEASIHETLEQKGYRKGARSEANLLVSYDVLDGPASARMNKSGAPGTPKMLLVLVQDPKTLQVLWSSLSPAPANEETALKASIKAALERIPARVSTSHTS